MKRALVSIVCCLGMALPALAAAKTVDQVRQELIRAHMRPALLYPSSLPDPFWSGSNSTLTRWRYQGVNRMTITFGHYGGPYIMLQRLAARDVDATLALGRQHPSAWKIARVTIGSRRVYRGSLSMAFSGYFWKAGKYSYWVETAGNPSLRSQSLRDFISALNPLGSEWVGRTSQDQPLTLYRSRAGLDATAFWNGTCADGSHWDHNAEEDFIEPSPVLSFRDTYSYRDTGDDGTPLRLTVVLGGKFVGASQSSATGYFGAHAVDTSNSKDQAWNCGALVSWNATRIR
jgi:hypothetical protein